MNLQQKIKHFNTREDASITPVLSVLMIVFVSFLLMSNILANRMLKVGTLSMDCGNLTFPVTYVLSDLFSEVYGYKWSRRVTTYATIMNIILALFIKLSCILPSPDYFDPTPFSTALNGSTRIVIASIVSYYLGDLFNDKVFSRMKKKNSDMKGFAGRAIVSSIVGELTDSTIFTLIAFFGTIPISEIPGMIIISVIAKTFYEILILPVTIKFTKYVKSIEGTTQTSCEP